MNLTSDDLLLLLSAGEGQRIEFKRDASSSVARSFVAFANAEGGRVIFGVNDKNQITGVEDVNKAMASIQNTARNCDPPIDTYIRHLKLEEKSLVIADISSGDKKPYSCHDGYFLRTGASSQKMNRDELLAFVRKNVPIPFDEMICPAFTADDFDIKAYRDFLARSKINAAAMEPLDVLRNLNLVKLTDYPVYKNAAVMFFGKEPARFVRHGIVTCLLFAGHDKATILDRKDLEGNLAENIRQAMVFLQRHLSLRYEIKTLVRKEILELPEDALREALLNAVIHRDYSIVGSNVMVEIYRDRVEIVSPGGLPMGMHRSDLGKKSVRRNPLLADLFHRLGEVEKAGSGISRILIAAEKAGVPSPKFESNGFFTVIFQKPEEQIREKTALSQVRPKSVPSPSQVRPKSVPENVFLRLLAKVAKPRSIAELMAVVAESNRTRFRKNVLEPLMKKKMIQMTEPDKPNSSKQRYVVTERGLELLRKMRGT